MKKNILLVVGIIFSVVFFIEGVLAQPSISSISGTVTDGGSVSISGNGFGSNALDIEWTGDNIEAGTVGNKFSKTGWSTSFYPTKYTNVKSHSGSKSLISQYPEESDYGSGYKFDYGSEFGNIYATWWVYFDHVDSPGQWKKWRLNPTGSVSGSDGEIYENNWFKIDGTSYQAQLYLYCDHDDYSQCYPGSDSGHRWISGQLVDSWVRTEVYAKESSGAGIRDGTLIVKRHKEGEVITSVVDWEGTIITRVAGVSRWRYWMFQNYWGNQGNFDPTGPGDKEKIYADDIFIQIGSRARIEIGDNPDWDLCTHREIQIPTAWSDGSITFTVNQGSFSDGEAYLFVVDENGGVSNGKYVEIAGDTDCGNGACDSGECNTCPGDCSLRDCCGDAVCQSAVGENCESCLADCGCVSPEICCNEQCVVPVCSQDSDCGSDNCKGYTCSNPGACSASCSSQDITSCINNDGCCPSGCSSANDNDCYSEPEYHWLEAEYPGSINSPLQVDSDASASQGQYIQVPNGTGSEYDPSLAAAATYTVTITEPGNYVLWGRTIASTGEDDSFFIEIDDTGDKLWDVEMASSWSWDLVNNRDVADPVKFTLSAGAHTIKVKQREDGTKLDKLLLTNDLSYTPSGEGESAENIPVCFKDSDCGSDPCKIYTCINTETYSASCLIHHITSCVDNDGCCPSACTQENDNDCIIDYCSNLTLLMHFDEDSSTVQDFSGNENNGIVSGATFTSSGKFDSAFEFDGDDDYVTINDDSTLDITDELTLGAWVYPTTITNYDYIISKAFFPYGSPYIIYALGFYSDTERLRVRIFTDTSYQVLSNVITPNQWYHVVGTYSNSNNELNIYINGVLVNSTTATGQIATNDQDVLIGGYEYQAEESFNGIIDEVAIWSRALSSDEILNLYNSGGPISCGESLCGEADTDNDGVVTNTELMDYISRWKNNEVIIGELMASIGEWKNGC